MGLGKTFQSIALLAWLRESRGVKGPHMIVVPKSVVGNWCREFKKFCPVMKVVKMGGTKAERHKVVTQDLPLDDNGNYRFDALVMSYEALLKEKGRFSRIPWRYLMIDEVRVIGVFLQFCFFLSSPQFANTCCFFSTNNRLIESRTKTLPWVRLFGLWTRSTACWLLGELCVVIANNDLNYFLLLLHLVLKLHDLFRTPLQNNLRELWALLNFLMPDIFGDAEQFDAWFSMNDETGKVRCLQFCFHVALVSSNTQRPKYIFLFKSKENTIKKLHTVLRPFMLRRIKTDVAKSLPPKKETKLYIGLTKMQQEWYVKVLQKDAHELNKLGGPSRVGLLNVLMQLRKVCNHPYLFDGAEQGPPYSKSNLIVLSLDRCSPRVVSMLKQVYPFLANIEKRSVVFCSKII